MKKLLACLLVLTASATLAQDLEGIWSGKLSLPQGVQPIMFTIAKTSNGYSTTFSPRKDIAGIAAEKMSYEAPILTIEMNRIKATYQGTYDATTNSFKGDFKQAGYTFPLILSKETIETPKLNRPQEPKEPFPYQQQEVTFTNVKDTVTLAGTLTIPEEKGPFAAVVLVTGSGPQNRNEELMGHKPFMVIADYLTRNGIAVLRYDDRGVGKSTGSYMSAALPDFANDANAAVAFLKANKSIDPKRIGIIGHSEGGSISVINAVKNKDVAFAISLAGPTIQGNEIITQQTELLLRAQKVDEAQISERVKHLRAIHSIILSESNESKMRADISALLKRELLKNQGAESLQMDKIDQLIQKTQSAYSPEIISIIRYNPLNELTQLKAPMLFIVGEKDYQVPAEPNVAALKAIIEKGKKKNITIREIPGANHLFQQCKECTVSEYGKLEETFSAEALKLMAEWINNRR